MENILMYLYSMDNRKIITKLNSTVHKMVYLQKLEASIKSFPFSLKQLI